MISILTQNNVHVQGSEKQVHAHLSQSTLKVLDILGHCAHMSTPGPVVAVVHEYLRA